MIKRLHDNKVKNRAEQNLLHDTISSHKRTKHIKINYFPILHECMNSCRGKARFNNFRILLESGFSSMIVMIRLI